MRWAVLLLGQVLTLAALWVAYRERNRREREQGIEKPAPYAWPKPERMQVRAYETRAGRWLGGMAVLCLVVSVVFTFSDVAAA